MLNDLFIGAGAMKAGTTWITKHLKTHPEIYFSHEKEISYFSYIHDDSSRFSLANEFRIKKIKKYIANAGNNIDDARDLLYWSTNFLRNPIDDFWYMNNFALRGDSKFCADFSNLYAHLDDLGWSHVKSIAKNLKVVYIMRDPLDRLWSHVRFQMELDGRFEAISSMSKDEMYTYAKADHMWRNSKYADVVLRLKKNLSQKQLLILFYEEIKSDPGRLLNNVEKFLNIQQRKYDANIIKNKVNASKSIVMPEYFQDLFAEELQAEIADLEKFGISIPESWTVK